LEKSTKNDCVNNLKLKPMFLLKDKKGKI